jgi:hypothetical protein
MVSYFSVEDSAGSTLRNLTTYITDVEFPRSQEVAETTTKGQAAKTYVQGHTDATITVNGRYDSTASTGPDVVLAGLVGDAGTVGFEFGPEGNANGATKYSGEAILTSYSISSPLSDVVGFTAEFQITGAVTKGTFSA